MCGADPDTLQSLIDKSLVRRREEHGQTRYWMLETIRELAVEQAIAHGEGIGLRRRHAVHYLEVALSANLSADGEGAQRFDLVIPERDNLRAALRWAAEEGAIDRGLELFVALENYWATSLPDEGVEWAATLLPAADAGDVSPSLIARALRVQGGMQNIVGQLDAADASWERALDVVRTLGEDRAVAVLLHRLSHSSLIRGNIERGRQLSEASLDGHRRAGPFPKGEAQALTSLAWTAHLEGNAEHALELLAEARAQAALVGFRWWEAGTLANSGAIALGLGKLDDAASSVREALSLSHPMHDRRGVVYELRLLAEIEAARGEARLAGLLSGSIEAELERLPVGPWVTHNWAHDPVQPSQLDPRDLAGGRQLSLDEAVALALAP